MLLSQLLECPAGSQCPEGRVPEEVEGAGLDARYVVGAEVPRGGERSGGSGCKERTNVTRISVTFKGRVLMHRSQSSQRAGADTEAPPALGSDRYLVDVTLPAPSPGRRSQPVIPKKSWAPPPPAKNGKTPLESKSV